VKNAVISRRNWKALLALAAVALLILLSVLLPVHDWIVQLTERLRGLGARGIALFTVVYIASQVALVPGTLLTLAAGFAYGPVGGLLIASPERGRKQRVLNRHPCQRVHEIHAVTTKRGLDDRRRVTVFPGQDPGALGDQ
jgi:hypothetical protein